MKAVFGFLKSIFASETVLEELDGWIDDPGPETSRFKLTSRVNGDVLQGSYPTVKFKKLGVKDRFICRTIAKGEWARLEIQPVPDVEITDDDVRAIEGRIHKVLPREDPGCEY